MREILSNMVNLVRSFCVCSGLIHLAQQRRQTTSSDFNFHHHQCQASHSGSFVQYQCNSGPWNIILLLYHEIPFNLTIWQFINSTVWQFHNFIIQEFDILTIWQFDNSTVWQFDNLTGQFYKVYHRPTDAIFISAYLQTYLLHNNQNIFEISFVRISKGTN